LRNPLPLGCYGCVGISFNREWGASEFHSQTVRGKNENLYASIRVVIAVKVEPSEERVTLVGCLSLSTEIATLPHIALPNRFRRASFLHSERVLQTRSTRFVCVLRREPHGVNCSSAFTGLSPLAADTRAHRVQDCSADLQSHEWYGTTISGTICLCR